MAWRGVAWRVQSPLNPIWPSGNTLSQACRAQKEQRKKASANAKKERDKKEAGPSAVRPAAAEKKRPVGRPRKKPGAEPSARRDPDRLCIDDARVLLVGDSPHARPPAPRDFLEPEGRKSQQAS